jgi:hypothetical protein
MAREKLVREKRAKEKAIEERRKGNVKWTRVRQTPREKRAE